MKIALKKILVAVDFSDVTEAVVRNAAELARGFGGDLIFCHVVERAAFLSQLPPGGEGYLPANLPQLQEDYARDRVRELQSKLGIGAARLVIGHGAPHAEVVRIAKDEQIDLIVVGTHGRGAIAHALLGSCAERVVRHAPCPVLTIRAGVHDLVVT